MYAACATAYRDGRAGHITSDDDVLDVDLDLAVPKVMGGPAGDLTNPEQMVAAPVRIRRPGRPKNILSNRNRTPAKRDHDG